VHEAHNHKNFKGFSQRKIDQAKDKLHALKKELSNRKLDFDDFNSKPFDSQFFKIN
jgi:hypothetical protein